MVKLHQLKVSQVGQVFTPSFVWQWFEIIFDHTIDSCREMRAQQSCIDFFGTVKSWPKLAVRDYACRALANRNLCQTY